jgi:hypothetical protein
MKYILFYTYVILIPAMTGILLSAQGITLKTPILFTAINLPICFLSVLAYTHLKIAISKKNSQL